jgi:uncharacterized phage protein (TIGR01671 family)
MGGSAMREILFRGKRIDNGEWVYGAFVSDALEQTHGEMVTWGFIRRYQPNRTVESVEMIEVHRYTIGQYTGLHDKNGKRIFEGDIVKDCDTGTIKTVLWHKSCFILRDTKGFYQWTYYEDEHEVIGNIHDNPELLEV